MFGNMSAKPAIKDVLERAIAIWRNEGHDLLGKESDFSNLQNDPVVQILLGAVMHQTTLLSDDINRLRQEVTDQYLHLTTPDALNRPAPAVALMQLCKSARVGLSNREATFVDEETVFKLGDSRSPQSEKYNFIPLLKSRVVDAEVVSLTRKSDHVWQIEISENEQIKTLSGVTFYIRNSLGCESIRIFSDGKEIPVSQLYEFSELPFIRPFADGSGSMSHSMQWNVLRQITDSLCGIDAAYAIVRNDWRAGQLSHVNGCIRLDLELKGVEEGFQLKKEDILLNCVPVCNLIIGNALLSSENPLVKLDTGKLQFVSLIGTEERQPVEVRRISTERQTKRSWEEQLCHLLEQYERNHSIYKDKSIKQIDEKVEQLVSVLRELVQTGTPPIDAVYLLLSDRSVPSVSTSYFMTRGAAANGLAAASIETISAELDAGNIKLVTPVSGGRDNTTHYSEIQDAEKYFVKTSDRVVSRSDIKDCCLFFLKRDFHVDLSAVRSFNLVPKVKNTADGYYERVILVEIVLAGKPTEAGDAGFMGRLLERRLRSRTASLTPIRVSVDFI